MGRIVQIRAESDDKILEAYTPTLHKVRDEWKEKEKLREIEFYKNHKEQADKKLNGLSVMFSNMFG